MFYAALFVALGVQLPFLPVWLAAKGLDARTIGMVLAAPMLVRICHPGGGSRRSAEDLRGATVIAAAAAALGYVTVGLAEGALAIVVAFALASALYTPIMPLADAYALRGLGRRRRGYGPVRLWGSARSLPAAWVPGCCSMSLRYATDLAGDRGDGCDGACRVPRARAAGQMRPSRSARSPSHRCCVTAPSLRSPRRRA